MIKTILSAVAAAALIAFAVPAPAQANMLGARLLNSGLRTAAPSLIEDAQYRRHRRHWRGDRRHRYRHCWRERVRVRVPGGYFVWRSVRRCGWRWRGW